MIMNCFPAGGNAAPDILTFTYSGTYTLIDDGNGDWRIKFLTSGTLIITEYSGTIDVFLVGGGGGTSTDAWVGGVFRWTAKGGGGHNTLASNMSILLNTGYPIVIGAGGTGHYVENTNDTAGTGGTTTGFGESATGGEGGETDISIGNIDGTDRTAYEFQEESSDVYGRVGSTEWNSGAANTGNGGGGNSSGLFNGGSGIVVIRNHRAA